MALADRIGGDPVRCEGRERDQYGRLVAPTPKITDRNRCSERESPFRASSRSHGPGELLDETRRDMRHPLVKLAGESDWGFLEERFGAVYKSLP